MSLPELPPQYRKDEQENGGDGETEWPVSRVIGENSPYRTSDADSSGGCDDDGDRNSNPERVAASR